MVASEKDVEMARELLSALYSPKHYYLVHCDLGVYTGKDDIRSYFCHANLFERIRKSSI
jgi:hypothetical protein